MATLNEKATWLKMTLDIEAEHICGEFGYDTCDEQGKIVVLKNLISKELIKI